MRDWRLGIDVVFGVHTREWERQLSRRIDIDTSKARQRLSNQSIENDI